MISHTQTFSLSPDVIAQEVADEMVLMDLNTEAYFGLNDSGTFIWQLLSEGKTVAEVGEALVEEFETSEATARDDVQALVAALLEAGLIQARETE